VVTNVVFVKFRPCSTGPLKLPPLTLLEISLPPSPVIKPESGPPDRDEGAAGAAPNVRPVKSRPISTGPLKVPPLIVFATFAVFSRTGAAISHHACSARSNPGSPPARTSSTSASATAFCWSPGDPCNAVSSDSPDRAAGSSPTGSFLPCTGRRTRDNTPPTADRLAPRSHPSQPPGAPRLHLIPAFPPDDHKCASELPAIVPVEGSVTIKRQTPKKRVLRWSR
jgi:hypothetical protein